jgi:hypothetical protein
MPGRPLGMGDDIAEPFVKHADRTAGVRRHFRAFRKNATSDACSRASTPGWSE